MSACNSTLLEKALTEKESSFGKAFLLKKRFVCKDVRRASWLRETRRDNGIYFKASYVSTRFNSGTGDIPCGACLHTALAHELNWKWV